MPVDGDQPRVGYRGALRDPVVRGLWGATAVTSLGDYIGQGALLILAFDRAGGRVVASGAVLAVAGVAALLTGGLAGRFLDRLPRARALVGLQILGAGAIALPVVVPDLSMVFVAAGLLGAVRAGTTAVRSAAVAESVREELRGPLVALHGSTEQASQVVGFLTGASLAVWVGASVALLLDAASFLAAASLLARVPFPRRTPSDRKPPLTAGIRDIFGDPVLRLLAPLVWVGAAVGGLPEALAAGVADTGSPWTPFVFAAAPAGQALTMLVLGRLPDVGRPSVQLTHFVWLALAFGIAALGRAPAWFAVSNLLVGSGVAWSMGPQLTFLKVAPPERMAQITGTMIAVIVAAEGLGSLAFAAIADAMGSVAGAYRVAGYLVLVTAVLGFVAKERSPAARELEEELTAG